MRYVACVIYITLILPLLPLAAVVYMGDKLSDAKWADRWVRWAANKSRDITGV